MEPSPVGEEVSGESSYFISEVISSIFFFIGLQILRWDLQNGAFSELHGALTVARVEDRPSHLRSPPVILVATSLSYCCLSICPLFA